MLEPIQASFIVPPFKILQVGRENFTVFEFFVDIFGNTSTWNTHPLVSFVNFPKSCRKILLLLFNTPFWPFFRRTIIRKWLSSHHLFSILLLSKMDLQRFALASRILYLLLVDQRKLCLFYSNSFASLVSASVVDFFFYI